MKYAELKTQFTEKDPILRTMLMQFAELFDSYSFRITRSKNRDKTPGNTVKFIPNGSTSMLCSLQFYPDPFLQFKWSKTTLCKLGLEEEAKSMLFSKVAPLLSSHRLPDETDTEIRVALYSNDSYKADKIINVISSFLQELK